MGDMSRCKHNLMIGYCDDCSPGWEMDLIKAEAADKYFEAGMRYGCRHELAELNLKVAILECKLYNNTK